MNNIKTLEEISEIELKKNWAEAIFELEKRIEVFNLEKKTILRLMFLYWNLIIEDGCIKHKLNFDKLVIKFKELFNKTVIDFKNDPEYLFIAGFMIRFYELSWGEFKEGYPLTDQSFGMELMKKAKELSIEKPFNYSEIYDGQLGYYFFDVLYEI